MPEITRTLRGNKDDTNTRHHSWFNISRYNWFGQLYRHWWEVPPLGRDDELNCSLRFAYFTVPAGAVISKAHLLLTGYDDTKHPDCHAIISAEDVADPAQISSYADFMARPRTAQKVLWPHVPPFEPWEAYPSPDLSAIVQHLVDTYPTTRSHIQLFIEDNGSARDARRVFRQGPGYRGNPPQLYIEYNLTPPPIAKHWLITYTTHSWSFTGKTILIRTDVPCHLYLRFKDEPPAWHARTTFRRGVPDTRDPALELKEFEQVEQDEPADTYHHTFTLEPFPPKERIWYYFIGTIAGGDVKSRSQFFRQEYDPMLLSLIFTEPWTDITPPIPPPPDMALIYTEPWTNL